jgi:hypothetical protein
MAILTENKNTIANTGYSSLRRNFLSEIPAYLLTLVYGGIVLPNHSATKP